MNTENKVKEKQKGIIYIIRNKVNKKCYIGMTTGSLSDRFSRHKYDAKRKENKLPLQEDMISLGIDKFYIEPLYEGVCSSCELDDLERYYIEKENTLYPNGYNIFTGGKKGGVPFDCGLRDLDRASFFKDYLTSMSIEDLASKYKIGVTTVYRVLDREGVDRKAYKSNKIDIKQFQLDYQSYLPLATLEEKYGISKSTIGRLCKEEGIPHRGRPVKEKTKPIQRNFITNEDIIKDIIKDYKHSIPLKDIAKTYNINTVSILNLLKKYGIERNRRKDIVVADEKGVINAYISFMPIKEIFKKFNVTDSSMRRVLRNNNIPNRGRPSKKNKLKLTNNKEK